MIRAGFLSPEDRSDLIALARDGSAAHRLGRRANALVLLDDGWSCVDVAKVLFVDDDTIRSRFRLYEEDGIDGLAWFGHDQDLVLFVVFLTVEAIRQRRLGKSVDGGLSPVLAVHVQLARERHKGLLMKRLSRPIAWMRLARPSKRLKSPKR
jgi:Homeodomain-like domain